MSWWRMLPSHDHISSHVSVEQRTSLMCWHVPPVMSTASLASEWIIAKRIHPSTQPPNQCIAHRANMARRSCPILGCHL